MWTRCWWLPGDDPGALITAIQDCRERPVVFHLVARPMQILTESAEISGIADLAIIELPPQRFPRWQSAIKRLGDIVGSLLALLLASPVLAVLSYLVWRDTGAGPIFRQRRVGLGGREFVMYKFRTMSPRAHPYAEAPRSLDDSGSPARAGISLDELPQLATCCGGMTGRAPGRRWPPPSPSTSRGKVARWTVKPGSPPLARCRAQDPHCGRTRVRFLL